MERLLHTLRVLRSRRWGRWQAWTGRQMLGCTLVVSLSLTLSACEFSILRSNPACYTSHEAPIPPPSSLLAITQPLVADGVIYVGYTIPPPTGAFPEVNAVTALRASDGTLLWRQVENVIATPVAVADGILILQSYQGMLALRASDGADFWRPGLITRAVTVRGGVLYIISTTAVYAIQIAERRILWQTPVQTLDWNGPFVSAPIVEGNAVYLASGDGSVVALRADTGEVLWTAALDPTRSYKVWNIPLEIAAGRLYVATNGEPGVMPAGVLRLNPANGANDGYALRLPNTTLPVHPLLMGGVFYVVLLPSGITPPPPPEIAAYRLPASGSQLLWRAPTSTAASVSLSSIMLAHDTQTLYFAVGVDNALNPQEMISAFRLSDGALLWRQQAIARARQIPGFAATAGRFVEAAPGEADPCSNPPVYQPAKIRALASQDGGVAWTHAIKATG